MPGTASAVQYGREIAVRLAPYTGANALPADTVAFDGTWGGGFVDAGYTSGGVHVTTQVTRQGVEVDQELDPISLVPTARTATMATNLAQLSVDTIVSATGQGTVTTLAPTTATRGHEEIVIGATIDETGISVGFDILGRDNEPIRVLGRRGFPNAGMTLDFVKNSATGVLTPLSVQLTPDSANSSQVLVIRDINPHS
jgi:hypothetical protein